jgi:hypothetical protein
MTKYNNRKTVVFGITFDSKKEALRYKELKLLEDSNIIMNLARQVPFELVPKQNGERAVKYIADFVYINVQTGETIVEDVKGFKTDVYKIKRKLFKWRYPQYVFVET